MVARDEFVPQAGLPWLPDLPEFQGTDVPAHPFQRWLRGGRGGQYGCLVRGGGPRWRGGSRSIQPSACMRLSVPLSDITFIPPSGFRLSHCRRTASAIAARRGFSGAPMMARMSWRRVKSRPR